jgi:hypothetical protein
LAVTYDPAKRCKHFNGTQNFRCHAGVPYHTVRPWPCLGDPDRHECELYEVLTAEELQAKDKATEAAIGALARGLSPCCESPLDLSHVIPEGLPHAGHGPRFCSKCHKVVFIV